MAKNIKTKTVLVGQAPDLQGYVREFHAASEELRRVSERHGLWTLEARCARRRYDEAVMKHDAMSWKFARAQRGIVFVERPVDRSQARGRVERRAIQEQLA